MSLQRTARTAGSAGHVQKAASRARVTVAFFAFGFLGAVWAARIPSVSDARSLSVQVLGAALIAPAAGAVVAMPAAGGLVSRYGPRRVFVAGSLGYAACAPLLAWAPGLPGFVMTLAAYGASSGTLDVAVNAEAVEAEHRSGRRIMGSFHAAWSVGAFAGAGAGGGLAAIGVPAGWSLHAAALAVVAVLLATGSRFRREGLQVEDSPAFALPGRATFALGVLAFCSLFVEASLADWSALWLHRSLGADLGLAATGFVVFSVAMVTGRVAGDLVVQRWGPARVVRLAAGVGAAGFAAALLAGGVGLALVGCATAGLGTALLFPLAITAGAARTADPGTGVAAVTTVGYLGWLVAPGLVGTVAARTSLTTALGMSATLLLLAAGLAGRLRPSGGQAATAPEAAAPSGAR